MRKLEMTELGRLSIADAQKAEKTPLLIVLDNVRSLYNVGAVFRTADAFLCAGICLCGITACPPNKEIYKTALGAEETVAWSHFAQTNDALLQARERGYQIIAVEQTTHSMALQDFAVQANVGYALVFGHEVKGVSDEVLQMCDACVEIPQFGAKHSLNISVSAGVVLWEFSKKMRGL